MQRTIGVVRLAAVVMATMCAGLINPRYTPVQVAAQSRTILLLQVSRAEKDALRVRVEEVLKGRAPTKGISLDLSDTEAGHAEALLKCVGQTRTPALLFIRAQAAPPADDDRDDDADNQPAAQVRGRAALHIAGQWFQVSGGADDAWNVDRLDTKLQETWAGGTDMLLRCVRYILADKRAVVPVVVGVNWESHRRIATIAGKVHSAAPVDLDDDGRWSLHIACENGDRLLQWDSAGRDFVDITAARKLSAGSLAAAWADFDGDGRIDLASHDGRNIRLFINTPNGFRPTADAPPPLDSRCVGLAAMAYGAAGRAALLASTSAAPLVLTYASGRWEKTALLPPTGARGKAYACMVADFDGDGLPDVLQPHAAGAAFYRGTPAGTFAEGIACNVEYGDAASAACLGDYDADGLLDIFVAGRERCMIWHNRGEGRFEETLHLSGEIGYIARPNARAGLTCDINADGRQDILVTYADAPPQVFFNRGFRSFGHAHSIDLAENELLSQAKNGQQAAAVADFNDDGAQDMALVLDGGEVWIFLRRTDDVPALAARAALPVSARHAGPVLASGMRGHQELGAWNLLPGTSEAYFGASTGGTIRVTWRFPGQSGRQQEITVSDRPARFVIPPPDGRK